MLRAVLILITATATALAAAAPAHASKRHNLSKTEARERGLDFAMQTGDLIEVGPENPVHMVPPRKCRRISHVTVTCAFYVQLVSQPRVVRGILRIHRQRDGLLGFLLPWDPTEVGVPSEPTLVVG